MNVQAVDWLWDGLNALVLSISLQALFAGKTIHWLWGSPTMDMKKPVFFSPQEYWIRTHEEMYMDIQIHLIHSPFEGCFQTYCASAPDPGP